MLVWLEKIEGNRIGEFIGPFTVLHHDESSKIVAIYQKGVIKRYSTSQIRLFLEQPSMHGDSIRECKIEDRQEKMNKEPDEPDEPEYDGDNVQMNVEQQSYGEQSITDDRDNVNKDCDQEITKAREILEQKDGMMKGSSNEPDQSTTSQNDIPDE